MVRRPKHRRRPRVPGWLVACGVALGLWTVPGPAVSVPLTPATLPARTITTAGTLVAAAGPQHRVSVPRPPRPESDRGRTGQWTTGGVSSTNGRFRVVISDIGVDAPVIDLGLNRDGSLQVPADYQVAGWYEGGPKPGDVGPAVIVGHVDSKSGPGVFYRLRDLTPGDVIQVWRDGKKLKFVVQSLDEYPKNDFPTSKVYGGVSTPVLRLITCGGVFNYVTHHYDDNIVVYAKLAKP